MPSILLPSLLATARPGHGRDDGRLRRDGHRRESSVCPEDD